MAPGQPKSPAPFGRIFTQPVHEVNDTEGALGPALAKNKDPGPARALEKNTLKLAIECSSVIVFSDNTFGIVRERLGLW